MLRIGVAQTIPIRGDVAANLEQHLHLGSLAADQGAGAILFPELSLTGYELDLGAQLAFTESDERLTPLRDLASSRNITLIAGAPVKLASGLHIGVFIISPAGFLDVYTKHHLGAFSETARCDGVVPPPEAAFFRPGDRNPIVDLSGEAAAVAICADTGPPAHAAAAAMRGAKAYLASMFVIPSEYERETAQLRKYAAEHRMIVAFANYGGATGGLASAGRSAIWSKSGKLVAEMGATGAGVAVAPFDEYDI